MSINVTVHGNPVSIKRGKMVTCDADPEFERRRKIRLQQVRQQSKEIAANVRNRVRKEKEKQLTKSEQQGEKDLKRWQTRKLLTLQQQYRDCIKEVGTAHTRAALERDPADILTEIGAKNQNEAETRGKHARDKLNKDENERKQKLTKPIEQIKLARKIENTRSAMVTKIDKIAHKKKKRKKGVDVLSDSGTCSDIEYLSSPEKHNKSDSSSTSPKNISIRSNFDCLSECTDQTTPDSSPRKRAKSPGKSKKTRKHESPEHSDNSKGRKSTKRVKTPKRDSSAEKRKNNRDSSPEKRKNNRDSSPEKRKNNRKSSPEKRKNNRSLSPDEIKQLIDEHRPLPLYSTNTQISDRIRQRNLPEIDSDNDDFQFISNDISPAKSNKFNIESYKICDIKSSKSQPELPYVATTSLRPDCAITKSTSTKTQYDPNRFTKEYSGATVQKINKDQCCRNDPNRFTKEYSQATVQKINKDCIHVEPCCRNETDDLHEKMRKQDRDAHTRGVKAMEKVKIQKDYRQLLEELPVLQKQERLAQIRTHNPKYHMDEERLREIERRRQTQIENIFDKYVHKCKNLERPLITIPPIQKSPPNDELKMPFRALDVTDSPVQLNVGEWTTEVSEKTSSRSDKTEKTSSRTDSETTDLVNKQKTLAELLQRVNNQRDLLLKEVSDLPPSSNLNKILQDDELLRLICPCPQEEKAKQFVSTATSPLVMKSKQKKKAKFKRNDSTSSDSILDKRKTLLIRNSETQTSPIVPPNTPYSVSEIQEPPKEKLCEITIKMAEETKIKIGAAENSNLITVEKITKPKTYPAPDISSSTTYMSPPDVQSTQFDSKSDKTKSYKDYLHKPQQTNIETKKQTTAPKTTTSGKTINPKLMVYIKKLLKMSRQTIDEMAVSSVSEISTPGPSVLETSGNNSPLMQLHNVMNHFDLSLTDVQQYLSISETSASYTENDTEHSKSPQTSPKDAPKLIIVNGQHKMAADTLIDQRERSPSRQIPYNLILRSKSPQTSEKSPQTSPKAQPLLSKSKIDQRAPRERSPSRQTPFNLIKSTLHRIISPTESKNSKVAPKPRELSPKSRIPSPKPHEIPSTSIEPSPKSRYLFPTREYNSKPQTPPKLRDSPPKPRDSLAKLRDSPPKPRDPPAKLRDSPPKARDSLQKRRDSPPKSPNCADICGASNTKVLNDKKQDLLELQADIDKLVKESFGLDTKALPDRPYSAIFDRYAELTQTTCDKITNLTAMIDKVRLEKEKLLSPVSSEKNENSLTSYMELPPEQQVRQQTGEFESSSGSSISQDAVDRYLLAIGSPPKGEDVEPFIPMLQGIPKYIEDTQIACENVLNLLDPKVNQFLANNKPKPPPSMRRNNLNIDMVPHELSTIHELDTIISSRNVSEIIARRSKSPESKKTEYEPEKNASSSDNSGFVTISPERYRAPNEQDELKIKKKSPKKMKRKQQQNDKIQSEMSGIQPLSSDKSTSPEDMELILRNLGLQWAVSTLKKTQEAMALSSSSSASQKKQSSSGSEVSLKEVLSKQFLQKSLYISESSGSIELANVSENVVRSRDRSVQRTSTPVQHSRSSNSKNNDNLFTGDSDLSSVKLHNSDDMFLSIPNVTLDTNLSLNKSKK